MKKILISGCSYTARQDWPNQIWPHDSITNVAVSASSNRYICDSIIQNIDLSSKPDFVFVLWTGLNKLDLVLPVSEVTREMAHCHKYFAELNNCYYFFDGGDKYSTVLKKSYQMIKDPSWPKIDDLVDFFLLEDSIKQECLDAGIIGLSKLEDLNRCLDTSFMLQRLYRNLDNRYFNEISLQSISNCLTFLEYHQIPYAFSFFSDVFADHSAYLQGKIDKQNANFSRIPWQKYITITPYEFGLKNNFMAEDKFHVTSDGMKQWAKQIKNFIEDNQWQNHLM